MIIKINEDLRIREDDRQYIVEKRWQSKGKSVWSGRSYCTTPKALARVVCELLGDIAADLACREAKRRFDDSGLPEQINALPEKTARAA
jgi:hypothetical protein